MGDCRSCFSEIKPGTSHVPKSFDACLVVDSLTRRSLGEHRRRGDGRNSAHKDD